MAECNDVRCPVHGSLSTYGLEVTGTVVSNKARRTVVVEREYAIFVRKYERLAKKRSKLHAHLPECMNVLPGDIVRLKQCRRLSKTKHWVVLGKG